MTLRALDLIDAGPNDDSPRQGADRAQVAVGVVTSVTAGGRRVGVSVLGSAPINLPAAPSTWTGVKTALVLIDPDTSRPVYVLGPAPAPTGLVPHTAPGADYEETKATRTTTITPIWSATHREGRGWDRWNTSRFGGPSDLYQGTSGASGRLQGLALYGDAVPALAATTITSATLTLIGNNPDQKSFNVTVQAATHSPRGPVPVGAGLTATVTGDRPTRMGLSSATAALLTGAGLALTGAAYGGVLGTGASMSIELVYDTEA